MTTLIDVEALARKLPENPRNFSEILARRVREITEQPLERRTTVVAPLTSAVISNFFAALIANREFKDDLLSKIANQPDRWTRTCHAILSVGYNRCRAFEDRCIEQVIEHLQFLYSASENSLADAALRALVWRATKANEIAAEAFLKTIGEDNDKITKRAEELPEGKKYELAAKLLSDPPSAIFLAMNGLLTLFADSLLLEDAWTRRYGSALVSIQGLLEKRGTTDLSKPLLELLRREFLRSAMEVFRSSREFPTVYMVMRQIFEVARRDHILAGALERLIGRSVIL